MKVRVRIHEASLKSLPRAGEVAAGEAPLERPPGELRLGGLAPDVASALPRQASLPRPSPNAFASLQAAAARAAQGGFDPRVATMLRRAQELMALHGEIDRRRAGGPA